MEGYQQNHVSGYQTNAPSVQKVHLVMNVNVEP